VPAPGEAPVAPPPTPPPAAEAPSDAAAPTPPAAAPAPAAPPAPEAEAPAAPEQIVDPHAEQTPPATVAEAPATAAASAGATETQTATNVEEYLSNAEHLEYPGYIPGYRRHGPLGLPPLSPATQPPVAGTPSYGAPTLTEEWTFQWKGYMTASLQFSLDDRENPGPGQSKVVVNTPPSTVDEWWSFLGTSTVPGNWIGSDFIYGNKYVSANVSIDTWQPSNPSTYYELGSQYFINKSFLQFNPEPVADIDLEWKVGYYNVDYGRLAKYGGGLYSNSITGVLTGVGESVYGDYDLNDTWGINAEHGIMTDRQGRAPDDLVASEETRWVNPTRGAAWIHHGHVGVTRRGDPELRLRFHHVYHWTQDDRASEPSDNPDTRAIDEALPPDAKMHTFGFTGQLESPTLGFLGFGAAYLDGDKVWQLRGFRAYAGDGEQITQRYWGEDTGGTGTMFVAGVNYAFTVANLLAHPDTASGEAPDITINAGFHLVATQTENQAFDGRVRHKYGLDVNYQFMEYMGVALRMDEVIPNSKDSHENFFVLAPRLTFRTNWWAHEQISLRYAKWFYGSKTRTEATGDRSISRIDDQLVALNFNMYW
jgi:hypothetical protein